MVRWDGGDGLRLHRAVGRAGFGLLDYRARYYAPGLGRFLSPDPIVPDYANPQSLNCYASVLNNPVRYTDPTGHFQECGYAGGGCGDEFITYRGDGRFSGLLEEQPPAPEGPSVKLDALPIRKVFFGTVPTVVGVQVAVSGDADVFIGGGNSYEHTLLFNWWSGEVTHLHGTGMHFSVGTLGILVEELVSALCEALVQPATSFFEVPPILYLES